MARGEDPSVVSGTSTKYRTPVQYAEAVLRLVREKSTMMPVSGEQELLDVLGICKDKKDAGFPSDKQIRSKVCKLISSVKKGLSG